MSLNMALIAMLSVVGGAVIWKWWTHGRHRKPARYPPDWDIIRREVYRRADYTCQNCGQGNIELHAHHIVPVSVGGTNALTNLACLCRACHRKLHPHLKS